MNSHIDATHVMNQMSKGLRRMVDEAEDMVKTAANTGDAKLDAAREKMQEQLSVMRRQLKEFEDDLGNNLKQAARATDEQVHDHPYAVAGILGLIGMAAGFMLARR
ncbi:YqjD family protein [Aquabacterium sp. CECT 9606]|uniref:DUF883 family protein n=1 Tax=Aquabacterium sp. CECT 9606 TaxID=2845822 RepID=UPI001E6007C9|nr:hypothetical protein [Aquabacterium sp. CECT 9606]